MHKLLEGIEDDLDDNLEDDLDDPEEDTDDREKEREKRKDHYRDADDEDIMLQKELAEEVGFYSFQQYCFTTQWNKLKEYANEKGIQIIGDVPIYVALDSSDAWANPS